MSQPTFQADYESTSEFVCAAFRNLSVLNFATCRSILYHGLPSKALFTAKQLTLFGSFPNCSFKASRRKKEKGKRKEKGIML